MTDAQELKSLEYINAALDEIGIPRNTGITRQTFTTWGRVSILIDRYKVLQPTPAPADARAAVTDEGHEAAYFINGEVDYASGGDGQELEAIY